VQSFESEPEAFRTFANAHPDNAILLVDTYDTLKSGVPNAITVGKEMEEKGLQLKAIRLDSGDLAYLSKKARKMLDDAGLPAVKIIASNQLNEHVIKSLLKDQNAAIDAFGIGTEMITGKSDAALDGVYKLTEMNGHPKMKISENIEKVTLPGKKQVFRCLDQQGFFYRDAIALSDENPRDVEVIYHPVYPERFTHIGPCPKEPLLVPVVKNGKCICPEKNPAEIHDYLLTRSSLLPDEHKRFISPHIYKAGISKRLMDVRNDLAKRLE